MHKFSGRGLTSGVDELLDSLSMPISIWAVPILRLMNGCRLVMVLCGIENKRREVDLLRSAVRVYYIHTHPLFKEKNQSRGGGDKGIIEISRFLKKANRKGKCTWKDWLRTQRERTIR